MKFEGMDWDWALVDVGGAFPCVVVEVGFVVLAGGLSWIEVEVVGATRVEEESFMTMLYEVECAVRRCIWLGNECLTISSESSEEGVELEE